MEQKGFLIFHGGEAFTSINRETDRVWLKLLRRPQHSPRLIVIPVAETAKAQKSADIATQYLNTLGTFSEYKLIVDQHSANTRNEYEILNIVEGVVLIDGSPVDAVERLRDTRTHEALTRGLVERPMAIMGIGASAMALGAVYWLANQWEPGLGIASHLALLPRHNHVRMRFSPERLLEELPVGITLLGVDEETIIIAHPDGSFQVEGRGGASVYHNADKVSNYRGGQRFTLDTPPSETPTSSEGEPDAE